MSNCALCSTALKFKNTPTFGSGKLKDGNIVCTKCYLIINEVDPTVAFRMKKHTLADVKTLLSKKGNINILDNNNKLEEIKADMERLNIPNQSDFIKTKEFEELPRILTSNENVDFIVKGTYKTGVGILVSTNTRVIFIDKGLLSGLSVKDFPLNKITSIQYETGLLNGQIKILAQFGKASIGKVDKNVARIFCEFIQEKLSKPLEENSEQTSAEPDLIAQLEKLSKLNQAGILTDEEFNEQKTKILDKM